jgi:hypothetical protein
MKFFLSMGVAAMLVACSQTSLNKVEAQNDVFLSQIETVTVAACKIDGQLQPVIVPLGSAVATAVIPAQAPAVAGFVALDGNLIHPAILAACKALQGVPVAAK